MKLIKRIAMRFDRREDRLYLALVERSGRPLNLWLTRRLANALADGLLTIIDTEAPMATDVVVPSRSPASRTRKQFLDQTKAELSMPGPLPAASARSASPTQPALIERLSIRRAAESDRYFIEFGWQDAGAVAPVDKTYARQVLTLLHRSFQSAGWSRATSWPLWLGDNAHRTALTRNEIN